jgi:hypothetical protein
LHARIPAARAAAGDSNTRTFSGFGRAGQLGRQ